MDKMLLVDGNSILFRAYYSTTPMTSQSGLATNAVYGFFQMLKKALELVAPQAVLVAFDTGEKTFRHTEYPQYKGTRKPLDEELIIQFPLVRELLDALGIARLEIVGYEADDLIGSLAKKYPDYQCNVLTSDKDLLQVIDDTTSVWLIKRGLSDILKMDKAAFFAQYQLVPKQMIDLKGLMGDASDNIPGIKGIGEKTALKLLWEYGSVENVLAHGDDIPGKMGERVREGHKEALLSKQLATIVTDVQIPLTPSQMSLQPFGEAARVFFEKYDMRSLLRYVDVQKNEFKINRSESDLEALGDVVGIYGDVTSNSYQTAVLKGLAFSDGKTHIYKEIADVDAMLLQKLTGKTVLVYDGKQLWHMLQKSGLPLIAVDYDVMLEGNLVDSTLTDYHKLNDKLGGHSDDLTAKLYGANGNGEPALDERVSHALIRAYDLLGFHQRLIQKLREDQLLDYLTDIEQPLSSILYEMEEEGVLVDEGVLDEIAKSTLAKIKEYEAEIFACAGESFNVNSSQQLAAILFDKLGLKGSSKRSTAADVLEKLQKHHPIVSHVLLYRKYQKLYSTYAEGLRKYIGGDHRIHTNYRQAATQTGRLSSLDPNLQNISVRDEEAREVRKAFLPPKGWVFLSADYSQIELRVLAHMANEEKLIEAFNAGMDIHTKTAMEVFHVKAQEVTSTMRRDAKAVNFGIVYGQSDFGLSEQLQIPRSTAKDYINAYFEIYPNIRKFMLEQVAFCEAHGYVETILHRRREIPEIFDKNFMQREFGKRAAMNAPVQGSAAELIKLAMIAIDQKLKLEKWQTKMILQVHDELIFAVPKDEQEKAVIMIGETMQQAMKLSVPLEANVVVGDNWFEAK